ncbi:export ABC transporter ATP-binding protein [Alteribacter lacisalsi]|uniref:Export ABC transporter ATP-binding protein n=1 Tax=Alteribacter lacisalsi TaxID=2045244 RepID=A0A2W0HH01_9BACI|nr:ABC transporter ATP-binding protein [Alteribacter lacisalsi]PYZ96705.1 export ABC transporter ATP-binding protein [Alteribacter lacisalsi]
MATVEMKNILKRYGTELALDYVDLEIAEGEILGLLGPNGAGKTTLIHALAGVIGIDSGEIEMFGKEQRKHLLEIKRRIGLVTQEITVFTDLTARENLEFFGGIYGLKGSELKQRVDDTLAVVGLTDHQKKLPSAYSGGMQRRLNIACAMVHRPKLLILDEPTVGIDPQSRSHIIDTIRELNRQGTTIVYTTHYMEEIQAIASRVVIMDEGHVIADGTVAELIERIQHEEVIRLGVSDPGEELAEAIRKIDSVKKVTIENSTVHIISTAGSATLDRVLAAAREFGTIHAIDTEKPSLEDVFLTLTGKRLRDKGEE